MPVDEPADGGSASARPDTRLERSLARLDQQIRRWSPTRWIGRAGDGRERTEIAYGLALLLADLGRRAGNGAPDMPPPRVAPHAIADQLAVLGGDLLNAPTAADAAQTATAAIERAMDLL